MHLRHALSLLLTSVLTVVVAACSSSSEPATESTNQASSAVADCRPHPNPLVRCRLAPESGGTNYSCPATEAEVVADASYCRRDEDTNSYDHKGTCYRQIPQSGATGGNQCCYTGGFDNCTGSYDLVSVASSKASDGSCGVAALSACSHCNEDVRPFCERNCTRRYCSCPGGATAETDPVACERNPLCVWQPADCSGSVALIIPNPASCDLPSYRPAGDRTTWDKPVCSCGKAGDALCGYRAPTLERPARFCAGECLIGQKRCGVEGTVGANGRPATDTNTNRVVVCRDRASADTCRFFALDDDCGARSLTCQTTIDGARCAEAGAAQPRSIYGKVCNTDDDCPSPQCGCYVANDKTKFCRYEADPENRPCYDP